MADLSEARKPLLSLSTFVERKIVAVDGHRYELRNGDELDPVSNAQITRDGIRMAELEAMYDFTTHGMGKFSDEDAAEFGGLYDRICRVALMAPAEVHDRLTFPQRRAVVLVFTGRSPQRQDRDLRTPNGAAVTPPVIGAKPSRALSGSMVGRRKRG